MKTDAMTMLREAARTLSAAHESVTTPMLYQALGVSKDDQTERSRIRRRCNQLVQSGEMTRLDQGIYRYNKDAASARVGELVTRMWRAMTSTSSGFSVQDVARISGACLSHASKYISYLADAGYVRQHGKHGNSRLYRGTGKMRETLRAPMPPRTLSDPFADERKHVHELVGLFLLKDMHRPAVQQEIVVHCRAIEARFTQNEK